MIKRNHSPKSRSKAGKRKCAPVLGGALAASLALLCALVCGSSPALAIEGHVFAKSFDGASTNALSKPKGIAVDQATGEVYVVDSGNDRVEIFSSSGSFVSAFGKKGTGNGEFTEPTEVAADNSKGLPGDVYVIDGGVNNGANRIEIFDSKGVYQSQITRAEVESVLPNKEKGKAENFRYIDGIAVDGSDNVWLYAAETGGIALVEIPSGGSIKLVANSSRSAGPGFAVNAHDEFLAGNGSGATHYGSAGEILEGFGFGESPAVTGIALNPTSGDPYLDRGTVVAHFTIPTSGSIGPSDTFGSGTIVKGAGIAVGANGDVYVADTASTESRVDLFTPVTLATVSLQAATGVESAGATLNGSVNPEGVAVSECEFEYGTVKSGSYGEKAACSPAPGSGSSAVAVAGTLKGLTANTSYHYRLTATNANGGTFGGQAKEFKTAAEAKAPSELETGLAEEVTSTGAKLTGKLNPGGEAKYYFEYGEAACGVSTCGTKSTEGGPLTGEAKVSATPIAIGGLKASTTYHYWLVATNTAGTVHGVEQQFTTSSRPLESPSEVETGSAEEVTSTSAKLTGELNPGGEAKYYFEYGEAACGASSCGTKTGEGGPLTGAVKVSAGPVAISGLKPDTTYHYWIVAANTDATIHGSEAQFTTQVAVPTEVDTGPAEEVAQESAKLTGELNPGGEAMYYFEYGEAACGASSCGTKTSEDGPLTGGVRVSVSPSEITGLKPETTYHYWLVATNTAGTVHGTEQQFTTSSLPLAAPSELETGAATEVTPSSAKLAGKLNPGGEAKYYFEYGEAACGVSSCGTKSAEGGPLSGRTQTTTTPIALTGLKPETTYHYWLVATNTAGTTHGAEAQFTTPAKPLTFPLTVQRYGEGTIISSPAGISCGTGSGCTAEFEAGKVTLTETPAKGYEFAGWIGCKRIAETNSCEIQVSAADEVAAIFLKAGEKGETGSQGPQGSQGSQGSQGAQGSQGPQGAQGSQGPQGPQGSQGVKGETGANGANGPAGSQGEKGPAGAQGPAGAAGPAGPQGPAGPAGQIELVKCRTIKAGAKKVLKCTTQTVSGPVKFTTLGLTAHAMLSRHGVVYASGTAQTARTGNNMSLRLRPLRKLRSGHYTLTLIGGSGVHQTIRNLPFTLGGKSGGGHG